jgi:hypothetical protein
VVASRKKGRCGRKAIPFDLEQLRNIPLKERMTIEDVCSKLNLSKWKIQRYLKKEFLRRHSSSIKPYLTDANKKARLQFCIDMIETVCLMIQDLRHCLTLCSLMKNGFTSHKNLRNITCYPKKMIPIVLVRTRITSLGSCSCVFVLDRGLGMESVFLTGGLVVFHLSLMNQL